MEGTSWAKAQFLMQHGGNAKALLHTKTILIADPVKYGYQVRPVWARTLRHGMFDVLGVAV
jgi:hypothetical protein